MTYEELPSLEGIITEDCPDLPELVAMAEHHIERWCALACAARDLELLTPCRSGELIARTIMMKRSRWFITLLRAEAPKRLA